MEIPKMEDGELRSSSERRQEFVPGSGDRRALLPSPLGPLHATSPPCPPRPCARLQSPHSTIPQDSWGFSQAIPVPVTCLPFFSLPSGVQRIPKSDRGRGIGEAGTFLREVAGMPCVPWGPGVGSQGPPPWKRRADT